MIPVHNHSEYSALDGYAKPEEIVERITELGLPGCFITDHGTVAGFPKLTKAFKDAGLWLGYGMEAYQARTSRLNKPQERGARDTAHLVLLAENDEGYANLMRLSDEANRTGFHHRPRVDWELLKKYNEGIIATSACMGGLVAQGVWDDDNSALNSFLNIFGDRFFIELHTYDTPKQEEMNTALVSIANTRGIPVVYANDAHYAFPEDYEMHELLLCMQYQEAYGEKKRRYEAEPGKDPYRYHPPTLYIMPEEDVREHLRYLPEAVVDAAIDNSDWLYERCQVGEREFKLYLPEFGDDREESVRLFREAVAEGIEYNYGDDVPDEVWERADYEVEAIIEAGFADYFLMMADAMDYCRRHGIMIGPGRGSAAGAIIAYAMGITAICPLKYNLYFERFWNPGRAAGLPDIDVDIEVERREEVKQYLIDKYGEYRVLSIGNHSFMKPKGTIMRAGRALYGSETPYGVLKTINKLIEGLEKAGKQPTWEKILGDEKVGEQMEAYYKEYPELFDNAIVLEDRLDNYSVHASAVVISSVDLPEHLPSRMSSDDEEGEKNKTLVTQFEMKAVEGAGFPKFDFLGLRNLDTLMQTALLSGEFGADSRETRQEIIDYFWALGGNYTNDGEADEADPELWEQFDTGHTLGLFQIEEGGQARRIAKEMRPRSISDLGIVVAVNRPGPNIDAYLAKRAGQEPVVYAHSLMEDIPALVETEGEFVYQEAVIEFCKAIGFSLSDADHVRKAVGKKLDKEMNEIYPQFMEKATQHMPEKAAQRVWDDIVGFSDYGFNKAHSIAYGTITYWTAHAKHRWPAEYVMAAINTIRTGQKKMEKIGAWLAEAKRMGVDVLPPDVNHSGRETGLVDGKIYFGLGDIKGVGDASADWIIEHRPYESYEDFMELLDVLGDEWKAADKQTRASRSPGQIMGAATKHLVNAGAFDSLGYDRGSLAEQAALEKELIGFAITNPHLDAIEANAERFEDLDDYASLDEPGEHKVPGVIQAINKTTVKRAGPNQGKEMAHVTIEWQGETCTFAVFSDKYTDLKRTVLKPNTLGIFNLKADKKGANLRGMVKVV